jgi:hypothetical protein
MMSLMTMTTQQHKPEPASVTQIQGYSPSVIGLGLML